MSRTPRIALIGLASWDRLLVVDRIAPIGGYAIGFPEIQNDSQQLSPGGS